MNGDSYSSRGMAPTSTNPKPNNGTATDNRASTDADRHTSSRDQFRDDRRGDRERDRGSERRRSRSPGHRSSRPSRREGEVDTYSSSRDYREREREDRYSGRDRRGGGEDRRGGGEDRRGGGEDRRGGVEERRGGAEDRRGGAEDRRGGGEREWDRDRGSSRRDARRDDDERPPRRDRDLFDERRGGGGRRGDRGDRDSGFGNGPSRDRKKSASPPPKKKEPTPDLTDVVPILERKRRLTQWDIKPPGYENVTAEQAKLSGMFALPGAPRQQPMDPSKLQAFMSQPSGTVTNAALKPSNSRQSKRLLVHNLPPSVTEDTVISFFNLQLNGLNIVEGSDPCLTAQISKDQSFALLEFKTASDATVALVLDGITMEEHDTAMSGNGAPSSDTTGLIIRRPKDYIVPAIADDTVYEPGVVSNIVVDTQNKISVSKIPPYLTDEQVTELLVAFGELKAFILVKDNGTEESRGIAFCEYVDPAVTDIAVEGLNGMELGEANHLKVQRASIGQTQVSGLEMGVNAMSMLAGTTSQGLEEGRVLQLLNMVTPEELIDNEDYEEICEDVKEECEKYGKVLEIKVPRPSGGSRQSAGVGKIFVKFDNSESAGKALRALAGRKFADRTVVTTYFSEENFEVSAW